MTDLDEREWWAFQMPEAICWAPALSEDDARKAIAANHCRELAPRAMFYPLIMTRVTSRQALVAGLLKGTGTDKEHGT